MSEIHHYTELILLLKIQAEYPFRCSVFFSPTNSSSLIGDRQRKRKLQDSPAPDKKMLKDNVGFLNYNFLVLYSKANVVPLNSHVLTKLAHMFLFFTL